MIPFYYGSGTAVPVPVPLRQQKVAVSVRFRNNDVVCLHLVDGGLVGAGESWYSVSQGDCASYAHHSIAQGASVSHGSLGDFDF